MKEEAQKASIFIGIVFALYLAFDFVDEGTKILSDWMTWLDIAIILLIFVNVLAYKANLGFAPIISWLLVALFAVYVCALVYYLIDWFSFYNKLNMAYSDMEESLAEIKKLHIKTIIDFVFSMGVYGFSAIFFIPKEKSDFFYSIPRFLYGAYIVFTIIASLI